MVQIPSTSQTLYPDSDGKPMAENTVQYRWIVRLVSNLRRLFTGQNVFVAGDLLWYPVRVEVPPAPSLAPDAMVVFGRPPGDRGSYKQWEEDNMAPQVVFEILSPSNTRSEMLAKQTFYQQYGVLEMFFYDPESRDFWGFARGSVEEEFMLITPLNLPWTSPLLQIRFELFADGLAVFYPNGEPFQDPEEVMEERDRIQEERDRAIAKLRELGIDPNQL
ncbi:Uma2 family endonuclease [Roseofilum casamattae]|uniref:Uma2 family endonuclease n=1 Tax=Roseofilum casamattae BLCC-M143 TaxID=3022442 RepID=A0ABT7C0H5_9CYAN|nr:Uma2 family endonuclease [Roseofilum casamattae]MDJ1184945.1 Uma2 family endonuclease [Roseofilum casamattae BLCC-M143]